MLSLDRPAVGTATRGPWSRATTRRDATQASEQFWDGASTPRIEWSALLDRLRSWRPNVTSVLIVLIALTFIIPSRLVLRGPLGAAGRPSLLVGLALFVLWSLMFLVPRERRPFQPVRLLVGAYVAVWLASVATAYLRGLTGIEGAGIERFMLITLSLAGTALVMADHLPDRDSLDRVLTALVAGAAFMGFVGFVQFQLRFDLTRFLELPGLRPNTEGFEAGLAARGDRGFSRAVGTAAHSIEFAVLSAMVLPLAIHFAFGATDTPTRRRRWALAALVAVGIPFSLSRSGIIAAVAVLVVLLRLWNGRAKLRALAVLAVSVVVLRATVPGLVGTFVSFFANAGSDNSVTGRTQDYELVTALFEQRPWLGLGGGTFRPEEYFILDNYLLNALVSTGVLGLVTVLALFLGTYGLCIRMTRRLTSNEDRHLAGALAASALGGLLVSLTFDSLNFASFATVFFVIVGAFGALWRLRDTRLVAAREIAYGGVTKTTEEAWPGPIRYLRRIDEPLPPKPPRPVRTEPRLEPAADGGATFGSALRWSALMNGGRQLATIGVSFLLAAQLGPRVFGVVAIATVYVAFVQMLLQQGMGAALIQRRDLRGAHLDTAFWLLISLGTVLSVASVALSSWWASVNDLPELRDVIWGLTPLILLRAMLIVPDALLRRRLEFRPLAVRTNASVIVGGLAGVLAAVLGAGVWALVIQQLTTAAIEVLVVWGAVDWFPRRRWSTDRARELISFTGPSTLAGFGVFVNARADALITGILLGPVAVGLHRFGARLVDTVVEAVSGSLRAVALPELSRLQDERHAFVARLVGIVGLAAGVAVIPLTALAAAASPLLDLAGDEWRPAVPALAILAIAGAGRTIGDLIGPVLQSLGRPGLLAALAWIGGLLSAGALVVTGLAVRDQSSGDQVIGLAAATAVLYGVVFLGLNAVVAVRYAGVPARSLVRAVRPAAMSAPIGYGAGVLAGRGVDGVLPALAQVAVIAAVAAGLTIAVLWLLDPKVRQLAETSWRRVRPATGPAATPPRSSSLTPGGAHMPRLEAGRPDGDAAPPRMLVAIAYHGTRNEPHVLRLIDEYRSMRFEVDIVLLTDEAKLITGVEQRIGAPISDPWSLPFGYQQLFAERRDDYDLFVYTEDDTLITEAHVDAFLDASADLPDDLVPGFLRVEERPDGTLSCSTVHNHYHWEPDSALRVGDDVYGVFSNPHAGSFLLTGEQLDRAIESGGFLLPPRAGRFDMLVTAATAPYTSCGMRKVICLTRLDDFLLPHLTNKYVDSMGLPIDEVRAQANALVGTLDGTTSTDRLFDPTSHLDDGRWDKRFYEPVDRPVLDAIPLDAGRVLSVGVGSGALEAALADRGHEVTGIPLDALIAVSARARGIALTAPDLGRALASLHGRRFDAVVFARSLHHFDDPTATLEQVLRLVDAGGAVIASFPNLRRHRTQTRLHRASLPVPSGDHHELGVHLLSRQGYERWFVDAGVDGVAASYTPTRWGPAASAVAGERLVLSGVAPEPRPDAPAFLRGDTRPRVSIGIPVFNGEDYLASCLRSATEQDLDDLEIVICDNASTDATEEICRTAAAADGRIHYHRQATNRGAAFNYNDTFRRSEGELFSWLAHDDLRDPAWARRSVEAFDELPDSVVLVHPRASFIDEHGDLIGPDTDVLTTRTDSPHVRLRKVLAEVNMANAVFGLIRSSTLEQTRLIGPFIASDYVLLAEIAMLGEIVEIPEPLLLRRQHVGSSRAANLSDEEVARWFDTDAGRPQLSAKQRLLIEYSRSVMRLPLTPTQRAACLATIPTTMGYRLGRNAAGRWKRSLVGGSARP